MSALVVVAFGALIALNWGLHQAQHDATSRARSSSSGQGQPYGEVTGFDPPQVDTGNPSSAYSIRLQGSQDVVWVGERLVVVA
jgi:hypothetical protein